MFCQRLILAGVWNRFLLRFDNQQCVTRAQALLKWIIWEDMLKHSKTLASGFQECRKCTKNAFIILVEYSSIFERIFSAFSLVGRCRSFDGETNDMLEYMKWKIKAQGRCTGKRTWIEMSSFEPTNENTCPVKNTFKHWKSVQKLVLDFCSK